jgi:hypothetical protein
MDIASVRNGNRLKGVTDFIDVGMV